MGPSIFVGRQQEMAGLSAALDDAISGHGLMTVLAGEPGIGKTRIAQELASYADQQEAQVLWGWCYDGEGALPYWQWIQPLRSYVRTVPSSQLESEMGSGAADIANLLPELHEILPGMKQLPQLDPEQARFRLFDSIAIFPFHDRNSDECCH